MTKDSGRKATSIWRLVKASSIVPLASIYVTVTETTWPSWWVEAVIAVPVLIVATVIMLDLTSPTQEDNSHE